ncbi:ABC transporter permease subunit [Neobacillus vireti]|uniref:ABC transporter permease subunit n=1 Tax=Neobacillus vireti TaxID=220686 RepID=UPI003000A32A
MNIPVFLKFNAIDRKIDVDLSLYWEYSKSNLLWFVHIKDEIPFIFEYLNASSIHKYKYTMSIISLSILYAIIVSLAVSVTIMLLPATFRKRIKSIVDFITSAPELLIIFLLQYLVIYLFRTYGIKLFQLYGGISTQPYFLPVFVVSFLPTLFFIQFLLAEFAKEELKDYVLLARAKGLSRSTIYIKHIIRNIIPLLLIHLQVIVWYILPNVIVVENLFNIDGYLNVISSFYLKRIVPYIISLLLLTVPVLLTYFLSWIVTIRMNRKEQYSL